MFNEEGNIARDVSIHHHNAGIYGATRVVGINGGSALRFDGNDYLALPVNLPSPENGFSVQFWIKPAPVKQRGFEYIAGELNRWYIRMSTDNQVIFRCMLNGDGEKKKEISVGTTTKLTPGQWYHVAVSFDGRKSAISVNGKVEATAQGDLGGFASPGNFSPIMIGSYPQARGFRGDIAELRIHTRACSEEEFLNAFKQFSGKDNHDTATTRLGNTKVLLAGTKSFDGVKDFVETVIDNERFFDPGNVFAVSGWFKANKTTPDSFVFCFGDNSFLRFNSAGSLNFGVNVGGWQEISYSKSLSTGEWHHFFCSYDGIRMSMGIDGELDSVLLVPGQVNMNKVKMLVGASGWGGTPKGFFDGQMRDVKVYSACVDYEQLARIDGDPSLQEFLRKTAQRRLEQLARVRRGMEESRKWISSMLDAPLAEGSLPENLNAFVTPAMSPLPVLPGTDLANYPSIKTTQLFLAASPGETITASLVFRSSDPIKDFLLKPSSEFTSDKGKPSRVAISIKGVKHWYQDGNAGIRIERNFEKVLYPELLLNDDSLVVVDEATGDNYLNTGDSNNPLVWVSEGRDRKKDAPSMEFRLEDLPIKDAATLQPLQLPAKKNKQFFLTVKVGDDAQPGTQAGTVDVYSGNELIGKISVAVQILNIKLALPATRYDLAKPFSFSVYYWGALSSYGSDGRIGGISKNEEQLRAEMLNMRDHGITAPILIWGTPDIYSAKPIRLDTMLDIYDGANFPDKTLYLGDSGCLIAGDIDQVVQNVKNFRAHVREKFGTEEVYFYGHDERRGEELLRQRKAWEAAKTKAAAKIIVSSFPGQFEAVGDLLDLCVWFGTPSREEAAKWHGVGHKIWNYYNPQAGVENPDISRRNYGLWLWNENYDGNSPYCYIDIDSMPWNDFGATYYRRHGFVYPTANGVVDTVQWEAHRTAVFDVRYVTTLRLAIDAALAGPDETKKNVARQAQEYLETFKPESSSTDLDVVRRKMTEFILELQ